VSSILQASFANAAASGNNMVVSGEAANVTGGASASFTSVPKDPRGNALFQALNKLQFATAAGAGSNAYVSSNGVITFQGYGAARMIFCVNQRVDLSRRPSRLFVGIGWSGVGSIGNNDPANVQRLLGFGWGLGDPNWHLFYNPNGGTISGQPVINEDSGIPIPAQVPLAADLGVASNTLDFDFFEASFRYVGDFISTAISEPTPGVGFIAPKVRCALTNVTPGRRALVMDRVVELEASDRQNSTAYLSCSQGINIANGDTAASAFGYVARWESSIST